MKIFLSYHFDDQDPLPERFIHRVCYHLNRQADIEAYAYAYAEEADNPPDWRQEVGAVLHASDGLVLFLGRELGDVQREECQEFVEMLNENDIQAGAATFAVILPGATALADELFQIGAGQRFRPSTIADPANPDLFDEGVASECAREIVNHLLGPTHWLHEDGLPLGYPFAYEKMIIGEFVAGAGLLTDPQRIQQGCPQSWPTCEPRSAEIELPEEIQAMNGSFRDPSDQILVDTRCVTNGNGMEDAEADLQPDPQHPAGCCHHLGLTLPEAGPRKMHQFPVGRSLRVGIVVSGGIAPGINAVIEGIVQRHELYANFWEEQNKVALNLTVRGYLNGLKGLLAGDSVALRGSDLKRIADKGGSFIGTSRLDSLIDISTPDKRRRSSEELDRLVDNLTVGAGNIDILYIIGGDGSMRAAHAIQARAEARRREHGNMYNPISVVGIPKTMDNDILWVWQAFGFMSAVETARELVYNLHTEASSNPRLGIIQLFGSDSGFVVSHAALASGVCDVALIPEVHFNIIDISKHICSLLRLRLAQPGRRAYAIILMAEVAIPQDARDYIRDPKEAAEDNVGFYVDLSQDEYDAVTKYLDEDERLRGQTPDALRRAGLKIVQQVLERDIRLMAVQDPFWSDYRVFTNEPRHALRSIEPSTSDIIIGQRLGTLAVDNAMAGYSDFMISQWLTEYVLVPLPLVVLGRKRVPPGGIFWKSVLARTGQPREQAEAVD